MKNRRSYEDHIRDILMKNISTYNSFMDAKGKNRFSKCVAELNELFTQIRKEKKIKPIRLYTKLGLTDTIFDDAGEDARYLD